MKSNPNELDMKGHLTELKHRVIVSSFVFLIMFCIGLYSCRDVLNIVLSIGEEIGYAFVYLSPQEALLQQLRIAVTFALFTASPVILFEILKFIAPVFEARKTLRVLVMVELLSLLMFTVGSCFAYKILLPFCLRYFKDIGQEMGITAQVSIENYVSLFLLVFICISAIFEMPLVCVILTRLKVVNAKIMKKARSVVIVVIFIIAAVITPPDIVSQCLVAIPMVILYQISIWLSKLFEPR